MSRRSIRAVVVVIRVRESIKKVKVLWIISCSTAYSQLTRSRHNTQSIGDFRRVSNVLCLGIGNANSVDSPKWSLSYGIKYFHLRQVQVRTKESEYEENKNKKFDFTCSSSTSASSRHCPRKSRTKSRSVAKKNWHSGDTRVKYKNILNECGYLWLRYQRLRKVEAEIFFFLIYSPTFISSQSISFLSFLMPFFSRYYCRSLRKLLSCLLLLISKLVRESVSGSTTIYSLLPVPLISEFISILFHSSHSPPMMSFREFLQHCVNNQVEVEHFT